MKYNMSGLGLGFGYHVWVYQTIKYSSFWIFFGLITQNSPWELKKWPNKPVQLPGRYSHIYIILLPPLHPPVKNKEF